MSVSIVRFLPSPLHDNVGVVVTINIIIILLPKPAISTCLFCMIVPFEKESSRSLAFNIYP